jgi:hypothetical protein
MWVVGGAEGKRESERDRDRDREREERVVPVKHRMVMH